MSLGDIIKKSFVSLLTAGIVVYLLRLWSQGTVITVDLSNNTPAYIGLLVIFGYVFINYVVYHFHISWNRATLFVLGITLLVFADTSLINNAAEGIFIGDIVKILGVIFAIAGPAQLFVSKKKQQEIKDSKMEIIEV